MMKPKGLKVDGSFGIGVDLDILRDTLRIAGDCGRCSGFCAFGSTVGCHLCLLAIREGWD